MPDIRARIGSLAPNTIIGRTALNIDGRTKDENNIPLPGAVVRLFRTDNNLLRGQGCSDSAARYSLSPYDATAHYVAAFLPATADSTLYTADNTYRTADRVGQVEGVTVDSVFGL